MVTSRNGLLLHSVIPLGQTDQIKQLWYIRYGLPWYISYTPQLKPLMSPTQSDIYIYVCMYICIYIIINKNTLGKKKQGQVGSTS